MQETQRSEFRECPGSEGCSGLHVRFESEEQARMVAECRARARQQREDREAQRARFRQTGMF